MQPMKGGKPGKPHCLAPSTCPVWRLEQCLYSMFPMGQKERLAQHLSVLRDDADFEEISIDSTVALAHQHTTGAPKKREQASRTLSRQAEFRLMSAIFPESSVVFCERHYVALRCCKRQADTDSPGIYTIEETVGNTLKEDFFSFHSL